MRTRFFSVLLALLCLSTGRATADTLMVYHTTGINGGPPTHTLYVFDDSTLVLVADSFSTADTIYDTLNALEYQALLDLFADNNFDQIDTIQFSGCLSCPEFMLFYDGRRVRGNTNPSDRDLGTILDALDDMVASLLEPTGNAHPSAERRTVRAQGHRAGVVFVTGKERAATLLVRTGDVVSAHGGLHDCAGRVVVLP